MGLGFCDAVVCKDEGRITVKETSPPVARRGTCVMTSIVARLWVAHLVITELPMCAYVRVCVRGSRAGPERRVEYKGIGSLCADPGLALV